MGVSRSRVPTVRLARGANPTFRESSVGRGIEKHLGLAPKQDASNMRGQPADQLHGFARAHIGIHQRCEQSAEECRTSPEILNFWRWAFNELWFAQNPQFDDGRSTHCPCWGDIYLGVQSRMRFDRPPL
eukprot:15348629-Alexandrium_andersonii.AAC.1